MKVKWISHRGESLDAPENTLAAFRLANSRKTDGMECDVMFSSDGVVVVSHDTGTGRLGDRCRVIADTPYAELAEINMSGAFADQFPNERIPTLSEALDCLGPGQEFFVELKSDDPGLVPAIGKILEEKQTRPEQIVIIARNPKLITQSKQTLPGIRALWLPGPVRQYTCDELIEELRAMGADGVNASGSNEHLVSAGLVEKLHSLGYLAGIAVVEHPGQAARIVDMGFDYITSSRAAKLRYMVEIRHTW